ncbi:radical SAM/SPASM domain-containing protein [Chromobacterium sp. IIBBL 290-4]|uniref:radical SAM/SPASM domain-containing protein n=1 Tax=Chromobacterium sp. IIBBL 290-4 TaxID=2953890 RepID=UPI0020B65E2D|nr:radical SAM protein [Chromobacterium sp. IIBBL 290-4]UTH75616.1 radical SAM protein [Chromobacterium sp. IIBBL 290-4]
MELKLTEYHVASEILPGSQDSPARIIYVTRTGKTVRLHDQAYLALRAGKFDSLDHPILSKLTEIKLLVDKNENEFQTVLLQNREELKENKSLNVTIQPTANCQLGCHYCAQDHKKINVNDEIADAMINRIISNIENGKKKSIHLNWHGGEPLLAYRKVLYISDALIHYCNEHGIEFRSSMVTNGVGLKPNIFKTLLDRKCQYFQITLDGPAETHDKNRMTKEGKPSFDIILDNLIAVTSLPEYEESGCKISIRTNISKENAAAIPTLINQLSSLNLQEKIVFDFQPIRDWGGNGADQSSLETDNFATARLGWILLAIKAGFKFQGLLPKRTFVPCVAADPSAEVYDAMGNVFQCYEQPLVSAYSDEKNKLGHIQTIKFVRNHKPALGNWLNDVEGDIAPCKSCSLFPVCGGGCFKYWHEGGSACPLFKSDIKDMLVLDYLLKNQRKTSSALHPSPLPA